MIIVRPGVLSAIGIAIVLGGPLGGPATGASLRPNWRSYQAKADDWYRSPEGARVAANILSHQSPRGSWPKRTDTAAAPSSDDPERIQGTFDNGSTVGEVRFLARAFRVTHRAAYRDAVLKAIDHILRAQYPTGGWPQSFPPGPKYHRHITYNDGTMVNLMQLLREVGTS